MQHQIWAEIDLGAIAHNCRQIKAHIQPETIFMAVVKANAYGHGAVQVAKTVLEHGAQQLAVARLQEAKELRQSGIDADILIFGPTHPEYMQALLALNLTQTVFDLQQARELSRAAQAKNQKLKCQIKLDTGMGRLGLPVKSLNQAQRYKPEIMPRIIEIFQLPGLEIQGLYTHLAQADNEDLTHAQGQLNCFQAVLQELRQQNIDPGICHAANSAGILNLRQSHLDLVRPGLILYGLYPELDKSNLDLLPAMQLKAKITQLKQVPAGFAVSYGSTYVAPRPTTIATLPVGYADGYPRVLSNKGQMLLKAQRATVAGRVCMDQTMLDVGHIPGVNTGDEVLILGRQDNQEIRAEELGRLSCSINYEIVSRIGPRVPRIYV